MYFNHKEYTIETERLKLRLFNETHAKVVTQLCNNYSLYKTTLNLPYPYTIVDALSWIENHLDNFKNDRLYEFAITDKATGEIYGAIGLTNNHHYHHGELAYWVGEKYWGNGFATEAAKAILDFAFIEKQYHKVFARYFNSNPASGRVLQKLDMKKEGILKEHVRKEGQYVDLVYCGIIKNEAKFE